MNREMIILVGDTHGDWQTIFRKIEYTNVRDCTLIHVGDVGIGFLDRERQHEILCDVSSFLSEKNIHMYAIRGNHDDPAYFVELNDNYSNLTLLPDYSHLELNGETWLFVGGAISIDREGHYVKTGERIRVQGSTWWHDEGFVFEPSRVVQCDVLVTHTAPSWIGPNDKGCIAYYTNNDPTLWDDCTDERIRMNKLIEACGAKRHYCGHFHVSAIAENNGCRSTILNINELLEHR